MPTGYTQPHFEHGAMRVLLVHPPMDGVEPPTRRTEGLGLGYIASVLRRDGHDVEMLDAFMRGLRPRELVREIVARDFDCLGLTSSDVHKRTLMHIVREVRRQKPGALLIAGGYFPTFYAERLLVACPQLDFVVRGEGESVISDAFGRIARGEDWRDAPGVAYLRDGQPVLNPLPPLVHDLDSLPFPARDELARMKEKLPALILSSRGCYHRCAFCSIPSFYELSGGRAPRYRSAANVLDEMEHVIRTTGIDEFVFADDNFIGPGAKNRERVVRFAEELKARNLDLTFTIECRVDEIDEDLLNLLKDVGLSRVFMGIESGVQRQLDLFNKRVTVEQNMQAIELVRQAGLELRTGFIMIDPYVTMSEVLQNMQFISDVKLTDYQAKRSGLQCTTRLGLYGGTPLTEKLRADGLLREKGFDLRYTFKNPQFRLIQTATVVMAVPLLLISRLASLVRRKRYS